MSMCFKFVMVGVEEVCVVMGYVEDVLVVELVIKVLLGLLVDGKEVVVGLLINYWRMEGNIWIGSVLVVVVGGGREQFFMLLFNFCRVGGEGGQGMDVEGVCLYLDLRNIFWRFDFVVEMGGREIKWEYELFGLRYKSQLKLRVNVFFVLVIMESMRIMFYSCNGFSVGMDEEVYSGVCLWNDVMRKYQERLFYVMIGGGDQIYNDGIWVQGLFRKWIVIGNLKKRRDYFFLELLREECDDYYLKNYICW